MRNLKVRLLLAAVMFALALGAGMMPVANASYSFESEIDAEAAGKWAEVCCGSACGAPYCIGVGSYTCCR
ncbi:MAG TPA: hypothetical protein VF789_24985 [Thermoanaerobaculia bacterium]